MVQAESHQSSSKTLGFEALVLDPVAGTLAVSAPVTKPATVLLLGAGLVMLTGLEKERTSSSFSLLKVF